MNTSAGHQVVQPWQVVGFHSPGSTPTLPPLFELDSAFVPVPPAQLLNAAVAPAATDSFKKSLLLILITSSIYLFVVELMTDTHLVYAF
jgi:hypothetical protein